MPVPEACGNRDHSEQPKLPYWGTVAKHLSTIADLVKRAGGNVSTIGYQAKPGEETEYVRTRHSQRRKNPPKNERKNDAENRPSPYDQQGIRVEAKVRSRNRQGMQDDSLDFASGDERAKDMAAFMNRLHSEP